VRRRFFVLPPVFDPTPGFDEARRVSAAVREALEAARPGQGRVAVDHRAQARQPTCCSSTRCRSKAGHAAHPITFLRAAWFMENAASDVARRARPAWSRAFSTRSTSRADGRDRDIGRVAAELLQESWQGKRVSSSKARASRERRGGRLGPRARREVRMEVVPRASGTRSSSRKA